MEPIEGVDESAMQAAADLTEHEEDNAVVQIQETSIAPVVTNAELLQPDDEHEPDPDLIDRAYYEITTQFNRRYEDAILEVGRFIKREFYKDDMALARKGEEGVFKRLSLKGLIEKLSDTPNAPKRSWIYNAVKLVVEYNDIKEYSRTHDQGVFGIYQKILLSHKVLLFPVDGLGKKAEYIKMIADGKLTIKQFREELDHNKQHDPPSLVKAIGSPEKLFGGDLDKLIDPEYIASLELPDIQKSHKKAEEMKVELMASIAKYKDFTKKYNLLIKQLAAAEKKKEAKAKAVHGTEEWSVKNINFSTGCLHGCLYCFARRFAARRKGFKLESWTTPQIRQHDVVKKHPKYPGRVMFPSSHDLIMPQWVQISIVLNKLLSVGNEVLIVSKPHLDVIAKICKEFSEYKPQMFFRFTIGSMDDNILTKWEPDAPKYKERKQSLEYAFEAGFSTSISCEPMLDADNIDALIADLRPYISDTFWIGKLDFRCVRKGSMDMVERKRIQSGQADGNIMAIYDRLKNDPLIRWKDSIKEVVGIERPTESGQDI